MQKENINFLDSAGKLIDSLDKTNFSTLLNQYILPYSLKILLALVIFVVGKWLAKRLSRFVGKVVYASTKDDMLKSFVKSISYFLFLLIVIIISLSQLGMNTSSLVALIGAAGLAVGLAMQNVLSNFASGVMILIFKPFVRGNFIEASGVSGKVEKMGLLTLELRTADNKTVLVPNSKVFNSSITNYSANATRRIDLIFDIAYNADVAKAKTIIAEVVDADSRVLKDPEAKIVVGNLASSSVQIFARVWVKTGDFFDASCDLREKVKLAFDGAGIEIPFDQLEVHLNQK